MSQLDWPGGNHFQQTLQCVTVNSIFDLNLSPDTKSSEERKTEHHQVNCWKLFLGGPFYSLQEVLRPVSNLISWIEIRIEFSISIQDKMVYLIKKSSGPSLFLNSQEEYSTECNCLIIPGPTETVSKNHPECPQKRIRPWSNCHCFR